MQEALKKLLLSSLDQKLTTEEEMYLEKALEESEVLKREKAQFLQLRTLLANARTRRDTEFPARVMERLHKEKKRGFLADLVSISPKVAAACVLFMLATLFSVYVREGSLSKDVIIGVDGLVPEDAPIGIENAKIKSRTEKALEMPKEKKRDSDNGRLH